MQNGLWLVVLTVAVFMGFLMGYSLPPMIETGLLGNGEKQEVGIKTEINKEMEEYYKNLLKDDE